MLASIIPSIYTITNSAIDRFTPLERDCYLDEEFKLPHLKWEFGYRYSMINCLFEAALQKIMTNCSCLHTSSHYKPKNISYCSGRKLQCAIDWMRHLGSSIDPALTIANDTSGHPLKCLQRCDFQTEIVSATASTFPNIQTFFFRPEFCYVLQKISIYVLNLFTERSLNHSMQ